MSLETIQRGYDAAARMAMALPEADDDSPVSDDEAASLSYLNSDDARDMVASLGDHDDAAIGAMVRAGIRKHFQKIGHMRRIRAAFSDIHGDDDVYCDSNGNA